MTVFAGQPVVVGEHILVTINCGRLIYRIIVGGIPNPTVNWYKDGAKLLNGSTANVEISADKRRLIINGTLLAVGGQIGNDGNYTCEVCDDSTGVNCRNRTSCIAVCGE